MENQERKSPTKRRGAGRPAADIWAEIAQGKLLTALESKDLAVLSIHHDIAPSIRYEAKIIVEQRIGAAHINDLTAFMGNGADIDPIMYLIIKSEMDRRATKAKTMQARSRTGGANILGSLLKPDDKASLFKARFSFINPNYEKPYDAPPVYSRDFEKERERFADMEFMRAGLAKYGHPFFESFNGYQQSMKTWKKYMVQGNCASFNLYAHAIKEPVMTAHGIQNLGAPIFTYRMPA